MKVEIFSKYFHANEKLIDFTQDKVIKIISNCPNISSTAVLLVLKKNSREKARSCKISLTIGSKEITVERNADSFEASVLQVTSIIARKLHHARQTRELK